MCVMMLLCFVCVVAVSLTVAAGEFFFWGGGAQLGGAVKIALHNKKRV